MNLRRAGLVGIVLAASALSARAAEYKIVARAALGGAGRWDLLAVDEAARRLYISRSTRVMVVDADTLKRVGEVPDTSGVHGIAIAHDLGRGFTSDGRTATSTIFDLKTLRRIGEVKTGQNPDMILYDPATRRVFVFNARSASATVFDAGSGKVEATIALGGQPELAVSDGKGLVFVNLEDTSEVVALDARRLAVKARWPLAPCQEPTGLALDDEHRRLLAACGNGLMVAADADTGRVVATAPIGKGPDGAVFDAERQLAFISNSDGTVTIIREVTPEEFKVVQTVKTASGAKTIALDPLKHRVYVVAAEFAPLPAAAAEAPAPRPQPLPDTVEVIVLGR
jgi:DNA-binding beta-propeller fold protein YncE